MTPLERIFRHRAQREPSPRFHVGELVDCGRFIGGIEPRGRGSHRDAYGYYMVRRPPSNDHGPDCEVWHEVELRAIDILKDAVRAADRVNIAVTTPATAGGAADQAPVK